MANLFSILRVLPLLLTTLTVAARPIPVTACLFNPDGRSLVVAHQNAVIVRSTADGKELRTLPIKLPRILSLALATDTQILAIAGGQPGDWGQVLLWDWKKNAQIAEIAGFNDLATSVAFSPDGKRLAIASADKSARVYDLTDPTRPKVIDTLTGHAGPILSILFSPDGKTIITASADRSLKVWDAASGKLLRSLTNHTDAIHALANAPTETWTCASAGDDQTVRIWQPAIGRMVRIIRNHQAPVLALAYSKDGAILFSAGAEGIVRAIDAASDQILYTFKARDDWVFTLAISPDGKHVATGDWQGTVKLWELDGKSAKQIW